MKVFVFRHNSETAPLSVLPDGPVIRVIQPRCPNMLRPGIQIRKSLDERIGDILVEEKLHPSVA